MVYDVNKESTFENIINYWLEEFRDVCLENSVIILLGNQIDRGDEFRQIKYEQGEELAKKEGLFFMETSAVNNKNVIEAF